MIDYEILKLCKDGITITNALKPRIDRAEMIGLIHTGISIDIDDLTEEITIERTAKTTKFGIKILNTE